MQHTTDAYKKNCAYKNAVLAIIAFANVGIYSSNATGYELQVCSEDVYESITVKSSVISIKVFANLYPLFASIVTNKTTVCYRR